MDHPKKQIPHVIHLLTEGSPEEQKGALDTYFLPDASFRHPLCRVPNVQTFNLPIIGDINSRWIIWMIYRWYKILSPRIILSVECEEFNQKSQILFVEINQVFSLFLIPFYSANVHLTTKLYLHHQEGDGKFYIQGQEDLYQMDELVKFFWPGGTWVVWFFQLVASALCILGALTLAPVTWIEQRHADHKKRVNGVKKA